MPAPVTSPAQASPLSPFYKGKGKGKKLRRRGGPAFRAGALSPYHPSAKVSGLDTAGMLAWAKDNKWYLLGGALLLGAAVALVKR